MGLTRYWVSWYSGNYKDEGCTTPPFQIWLSGWRGRKGSDRHDLALCAVIDADTGNDILAALLRYFPDCEPRFMEPKEEDFVPGSRFPEFENRTRLDGGDKNKGPSRCEYKSCLRCEYVLIEMLRSGYEPVYQYFCEEPSVRPRDGDWSTKGNHIGQSDRTPFWCPFLNGGGK